MYTFGPCGNPITPGGPTGPCGPTVPGGPGSPYRNTHISHLNCGSYNLSFMDHFLIIF